MILLSSSELSIRLGIVRRDVLRVADKAAAVMPGRYGNLLEGRSAERGRVFRAAGDAMAAGAALFRDQQPL